MIEKDKSNRILEAETIKEGINEQPNFYVVSASVELSISYVKTVGDPTKRYNVIDANNPYMSIPYYGTEESTLIIIGSNIPNFNSPFPSSISPLQSSSLSEFIRVTKIHTIYLNDQFVQLPLVQ